MKFPWHKYEELPLERRNTLQIFITNACNLKCEGCFARSMIRGEMAHISLEEYTQAIETLLEKDGKQVNLLGGEPFLHPNLKEIIKINECHDIKTTIYTNGYFLNKYSKEELGEAKIRVSLYSKEGKFKSAYGLPKTTLKTDANFMVSSNTTLEELIDTAKYMEENYDCSVFFISSLRELDNPRKEFFDDTPMTMPVVNYKELVHQFLDQYEGKMEIHISKRGVFESTKTVADNKCRFSNYFIGGKIIQCPYDIVNLKVQEDYSFNSRYCQHNNSCLMSKVKYRKK